MPVRKVVTSKEPYNEIPKVLTTKAGLFSDDVNDAKTRKLFKDMIKTMYAKQGIGLAGPQIDLPQQVAVISMADGDLVLINPKIVWRSKKTEKMEEGCLSLPAYFGGVERSAKIKVKALDDKGKKVVYKAEGMFARVLQHEIDHLNGILIKDRIEEQK